ncbi:MAG: GNAT family N-acetyltransferase [Opitutaceae bacterium]
MRFERYNVSFESAVIQLHRSSLVGISHGYAQEEEERNLREIDAEYLRDGGEFLLGFIEDRLVAIGGFKIVGDAVAEVKRVRISPEFQGQGIGSHSRLDS